MRIFFGDKNFKYLFNLSVSIDLITCIYILYKYHYHCISSNVLQKKLVFYNIKVNVDKLDQWIFIILTNYIHVIDCKNIYFNSRYREFFVFQNCPEICKEQRSDPIWKASVLLHKKKSHFVFNEKSYNEEIYNNIWT